MSLLMDALKKAEQERKEAAKRIEETEDGMQVDPATVPPPQESGNITGPNAVTPEDRDNREDLSTTRRSTTQELSLAPLERTAPPPEPDTVEERQADAAADEDVRD